MPKFQIAKQTPEQKIDARDRRARILEEDEERQREIEQRADERDQLAEGHLLHAIASSQIKPGG